MAYGLPEQKCASTNNSSSCLKRNFIFVEISPLVACKKLFTGGTKVYNEDTPVA